jgi:choline kinase
MAMPKRKEQEKPWERGERESAPAFEAFQKYLDMGTERSLRKLAVEISKSYTLVSRWSREKNWQERVRAYDNYLANARTQKALAEIEGRYTRFGKVSDQLTLLALDTIKKQRKFTLQEALQMFRLSAMLADRHKGVMMPEDMDFDIEDGTIDENVVIYVPDDGRNA